ncbi:Hypothetical protein R9X50_00541100 [Acrodontium crateriforme]|uniref:C2H2-type domain-containing protein n=1 Tax=Acrodontium crateriforme TaxID=150365 RepID=A0AAQ3M9J5_9PEZI|nr:Hypothetical protein R9X50_00541100 [Acrodontium crateriforme]
MRSAPRRSWSTPMASPLAIARTHLSLERLSQSFPNSPSNVTHATSLSCLPPMSTSASTSLSSSSPSPSSSDSASETSYELTGPTASVRTTSPLPSLYVTFKVLRLVNAFRQRVKTRVRSRVSKRPSPKSEHDFCQVFEHQAFEEVDHHLGRNKAHRHWKGVHALTTLKRDYPVPRGKRSDKRIETLLHQIDRSINHKTSLGIVAANNKLFLRCLDGFDLKPLSLNELASLVIIVKDLLQILKEKTVQNSKIKTIVEGNEVIDSTLDETYLANLEHMLLCFQDQILRLLVARLIGLAQKHLIDCQKNQGKESDDWFSVFPDCRHPLSTTWPWSIKSSLAVIWGVCWMFFADVDWTGQPATLSASPVSHATAWNPDSRGATAVAVHSHSSRRPTSSVAVSSASSGAVSVSSSQSQPHPHPHPHSHPPPAFALSPHPIPPQAAGLQRGTGALFAELGPDYASSTAPHSPPDATNWGVPQEEIFTSPPGFHHPSPSPALALHRSTANANSSTYPADFDAWPHVQLASSTHPLPNSRGVEFARPATTLPPAPVRHRHPSTPTIRVTIPQDFHHGTPQQFSASSNSSIYSAYPGIRPYSAANLSPNNLGPSDIRSMHHDPQPLDMNVPVSPVSAAPHSPGHPGVLDHQPQLYRKRSHSQMSHDGDGMMTNNMEMHGDALPAQNDVPDSANEDYSPRGLRPYRREQPPPMENNKYVCVFAPECQGMTFDRKCEWSKHMDKHDRPYRCPDEACAKLQGFTYSGGLLRHEREVHGKHGGPKAQLMCPYPDCKRHTGKGFTRKENLNEHKRRVHNDPSQSQHQNLPVLNAAVATMEGSEPTATPASDSVGIDDFAPPAKRQRSTGPGEGLEALHRDDLERELLELRNDRSTQDALLYSVKEQLRITQEQLRTAQDQISQMSQDLRAMQQMQQQMQEMHPMREESQHAGQS